MPEFSSLFLFVQVDGYQRCACVRILYAPISAYFEFHSGMLWNQKNYRIQNRTVTNNGYIWDCKNIYILMLCRTVELFSVCCLSSDPAHCWPQVILCLQHLHNQALSSGLGSLSSHLTLQREIFIASTLKKNSKYIQVVLLTLLDFTFIIIHLCFCSFMAHAFSQ